MSARTVVLLVFVVLAVLHQDWWLWDDPTPWFGVLPAGLGYHAVYSLVAAAVWYAVTLLAWPEDPTGLPPVEDEA
ncbi:MAG: hypothetical protein KC656_20085 [Myxococcales bacterium]|nr:hypothetical protein [Myxococcales bacterium]